mgnify:CR=1 FL=1|jgi:hypothetical protein
MIESTIIIIGWAGFIFCTVAYLLLNIRLVRFDGVLYQVLNVTGGLGLVISAVYFHDLPNIAANAMWIVIGVFGIFRYAGQLRKTGKKHGVGNP